MSLFIDTKYLNLISSRLPKFKRKKNDLWNLRCPFCGDSKKNTNKARGYFYVKGNGVFYKCHNCNVGHNLTNFIKELDPMLAQEYLKERYFNKGAVELDATFPQDSYTSSQPIFNNEKRKIENIKSISELDDSHYAKQYIMNRQIPKHCWDELYFTPDFKSFVEQYSKDAASELKPETHMIIIPFIDIHGELFAVQGRSFLKSQRYITIKFDDVPKIWGLNRVDLLERIFVLEGPFDAMFVKNGIAMAGADNKYLLDSTEKNIYTFVFDNEPYNRDIQQAMYDVVEKGFSIVVWDKNIPEKDINDMVLNGTLTENTLDARLNKMIYKGVRAKLELMNWRKR